MNQFTFGNPATVSLNEATRQQAVDILKGLAERLDGCDGADQEVDELLARYLTKDYAIDYTSSVDSSLAMVTRLYPSLVIVMCRCSDGAIEIREAWDAEDD